MVLTSRAPVNFRTFLTVAVFMTAAVFCAYIYSLNRAVGIVSACVLICSLMAFTVYFAIGVFRGSAKLRTLIAFAVSTALCLTAFPIAAISIDGWKNSLELGGFRSISGRVCAADTRTGDYRFDLEDLTVDGRSVSGILRLTVSASDRNISEFIDYGDRLTFSAYITAVKLSADGKINGSAYRTDIRYYSTVGSDGIEIDFGKPKLIERFSGFLHRLYTDNMGDKYGNIAYSMITGDRHALDIGVYGYFSAAGIGHILAVSGLHIGFLALFLDLVLSRVSRKVRFPVITAVLIAYAALADFSPSVVRAVIMAVVSMFSVFVGGRRDLLSSLMFSYSVILAVKPLYLFDVGFLTSFGSIFGIAMFSRSISRFLTKHNASRKVGDSVGTAVSVQLGIIPPFTYFFRGFQPISFIVNIVLIPYISVVFIAIVCLTPIAAIPHCGAALKLCEYLLKPPDYIAYGVAHIPFANVKVYCTAAVFLCYPVMFCASEFFMMPKGKSAVAVYSAAVYIALCCIHVPMRNNVLIAASSADNTSVLCVGGQVYVIGYVRDRYSVEDALENNCCKRIDGIFLLDPNIRTVNAVLGLRDDFEIGTVYCEKADAFTEMFDDNDIDCEVVSPDGEYAVCPAYVGGEMIGYEFGDILFAKNGTDERAFSVYDAVRTRTVEAVMPNIVYLCDHAEVEGENIYTLDSGSYIYELA
ncbi:MAG: competence protein ComEC family protein [Roseburia sp.]|nr:competence protein ComEC family protein [Roseburia sp.]